MTMATMTMAVTSMTMDAMHRTTEATMDGTAVSHALWSGHGFEPGAARPRARETHGDGANSRSPHHRQYDAA